MGSESRADQRIVVELEAPSDPQKPSGPAPTDWVGAVKQLRDVAQWIIGGVVATAAGVVAGSSLTKLGELDPAADAGRLWLAGIGVTIGFVAISLILRSGLEVIAPAGGSLRKLSRAQGSEPLVAARAYLYELFDYSENEHPLIDLLANQRTDPAPKMLPKLHACASFAIVRCRFDRLLRRMAWCVPLAMLGFGLFAWAANPPDPPAKPERGVAIKITQ